MNVRADAETKFLRRFLIIGGVCFVVTLWSLYDGLVAYPKELVRAEAYEKLEIEGPEAQSRKWYAMAEEKRWENDIPESPEHVNQSIYTQYVMAAGFSLAGLGLLWWYFRSKNTWIGMDDKGVHASWGARMNFDEINSLNKRRWDKKGIAKLIGDDKTFVLDDLKYHRPSVDVIIREIESRLDRELILNGRTEVEKDIEKKEKAAAAAESIDDAEV